MSHSRICPCEDCLPSDTSRWGDVDRWRPTSAPESKGDPRFFAILDELRDIHERKSSDYGTGSDFLANVRSSAGWGISPWVGTMVRANDKIIRLQSLIANGKLENESARDSLIDLASYAIIACILMDEEAE